MTDEEEKELTPPGAETVQLTLPIDAPRGKNGDRFRAALDSILYDEFPVSRSPVSWGKVLLPGGEMVHSGAVYHNVQVGMIGVHANGAISSGARAGDKVCFVAVVDEANGTVEVQFWLHVQREPENVEQRVRWGTLEQRKQDAEAMLEELTEHLSREFHDFLVTQIPLPRDRCRDRLGDILENMNVIKPREFRESEAGHPFNAAVFDDDGNLIDSVPTRKGSQIVWKGKLHEGPELEIRLISVSVGGTLFLYRGTGSNLLGAKETGEEIIQRLTPRRGSEDNPVGRDHGGGTERPPMPWENIPEANDYETDAQVIEAIKEHLRTWLREHADDAPQIDTRTGFPTGTLKKIRSNSDLTDRKINEDITLSKLSP